MVGGEEEEGEGGGRGRGLRGGVVVGVGVGVEEGGWCGGGGACGDEDDLLGWVSDGFFCVEVLEMGGGREDGMG